VVVIADQVGSNGAQPGPNGAFCINFSQLIVSDQECFLGDTLSTDLSPEIAELAGEWRRWRQGRGGLDRTDRMEVSLAPLDRAAIFAEYGDIVDPGRESGQWTGR